ncbi:MAG: VOC family protein [Candidatus Binataceae bacterium]
MRRLHHAGFAVKSIETTIERFAGSLGASWDSDIVEDPNQDVKVTFLRPFGLDSTPMIELVEPLSCQSPVHAYLRRGFGLYHLCYETESLVRDLDASRAAGALIAKHPLRAAAFGGRLVAWVYTRERLLLEFLQK